MEFIIIHMQKKMKKIDFFNNFSLVYLCYSEFHRNIIFLLGYIKQ